MWRRIREMAERLPVREQLGFAMIFCLAFFPAYGLGLWRGMQTAEARIIAFEWERGWPFQAWMIAPYLSLFAAYVVPVFFLPARAYRGLTVQALMVVAVSAAVFLVLPTQPGFAAAGPVPPVLTPLFELMQRIDAPRNLVPSLHVAGAAVVLLGSADFAGRTAGMVLRAWLALIAASTLFVHQHHLIDLATGLGLALAVRRLAPLPVAVPTAARG